MHTIRFLMLTLCAFAFEARALELEKVTDNVYAVVGPMEQRSSENLANNATFAFVVTDEGVVLVDPGGSMKGADEIAKQIAKVTDKPVTHVINSGGQDHRWIGNDYFASRGATLLASEAAVADHRARSDKQLDALYRFVGEEGMAGTKLAYATQTFAEQYQFSVGGVEFDLRMVGPAHTSGDTLVWLPEQEVLISGDVIYVERMLGVAPHSNSRHWLEAFAQVEALQPKWIIPGHGHLTSLAKARADTYDYLQLLRREVGRLLDEGEGMERVGSIDQSRFSYLQVYEQIKGRNAQQVYAEMEWE